MSAPQSQPRRLGRDRRIKSKREFSRMFDSAIRVGDDQLTLFVLPNELAFSRVGVAVSRRLGSAVRRNRAKRLCREAFRLVQHDLPGGWDYMLLPRAGAQLKLQRLEGSIRRLGQQAIARYRRDRSGR